MVLGWSGCRRYSRATTTEDRQAMSRNDLVDFMAELWEAILVVELFRLVGKHAPVGKVGSTKGYE